MHRLDPVPHGRDRDEPNIAGGTIVSAQKQALFWLVAAVLFIAVLSLFKEILLPFITGLAIAYFLDPLVDYLERRGVSRALGATIILGGFMVSVVAGLWVLMPILQAQLVGLVTGLPTVFENLRQGVSGILDSLSAHIDEQDMAEGQQALLGLTSLAMGWFFDLLGSAWQSGLAVFNLIGLLVVTPVVAWYLLRDWDHLVEKINSWLPRDHLPEIKKQFGLIDQTIAGFVRGQATVCLIMGATYALALEIVGLEHGLVVGLIAGLISFVPYIGSIVGLLLSVGLAYVQFGESTMILLVAAVFFIGQAIEGNFLTPKLVGGRVGLHAVWVVFALLAGGSLFGLVGMLLAVPVAAVIGVLSRFLLQRYLSSRIYLGRNSTPPDGSI